MVRSEWIIGYTLFYYYSDDLRRYPVFWVLLVHIGLPLMFGVAFVFFRTASSPHAPTWDIAIDTALDLAILGIGATGAIFENATIGKAFGEHLAAVELSVVGASFLFSSIIVIIKRYAFQPSDSKFALSVISIDLGSLALFTTSGVLMYAYQSGGVDTLQWLKVAAIALGSATLAGAILSLFVKFIISHTPVAMRIASDPKIIEQVSRSIRDLAAGDAITVDELSVVVQQKREHNK